MDTDKIIDYLFLIVEELISELFAKAFLEKTYFLDRWIFCL